MKYRSLTFLAVIVLLTFIPIQTAQGQVAKMDGPRLFPADIYGLSGTSRNVEGPAIVPSSKSTVTSDGPASRDESVGEAGPRIEEPSSVRPLTTTPMPSEVSLPSEVTTAPAANAALTGEVVVSTPAPPPPAPPAGGWRSPVNIPVTATVAGSVGPVHRVEFYADGELIGTDISAPYSIVWTNAGAGITADKTYAITAKAFSTAGPEYTSDAISVLVQPAWTTGGPPPPAECKVAKIVAFDQPFFYNRLGAVNPGGMIYALNRDVVPIDSSKGLTPGNVRLRDGKRARPINLRMNIGDCLRIVFQNLLAPDAGDDDADEGNCDNPTLTPDQRRRCNQPRTRTASAHVQGLQLVNSILDDGSFVGKNPSSLVAPGGVAIYTYYADKEGPNVLYSTAATTGGEGDGGSLGNGLFGIVNVEPAGAEYYRSQLTHEEMFWASNNGERWPQNSFNPEIGGQPKINYDAVYPAGHQFAGKPILRMTVGNEIFHSDLNAIITGPNRGNFPGNTYPNNPVTPNRNRPFREFSVVYHDEIVAVQAFPQMEDTPGNPLAHTLHSVRDGFAINYGTGGIGAEILANRFKVGPMHDCVECLFEEFFLSSWTVGDPAMIVDVPANTRDGNGQLIQGPKATKAFFPEDPSNVHHSYINDHTKFRVIHAGPKEHHIHHLHAHQWLHTPNDDNSTYLDSQAIGPGSTYTTEITYNGSGNRNKVVGDAIFHCHFYPHFAQGMWELWRNHDVFEEGTQLNPDGTPAASSRRLPDGEIAAGTPIPALVPIPTYAMAPMPSATVPGYPFFIAAVAGHRPTHPPLDTEFDGGLPRHIILDGEAVFHKEELPAFDLNKARLDFDKALEEAVAQQFPENGTALEQAAMAYHAVRNHSSITPEGAAANFILNGAPAQPGAPFADPCVDDNGNPDFNRLIEYKGASFQFDIKLNKAGWHFPQQRILALWADVQPTIAGTRPPEPLFFRANTNDCVVFKHTNLIPRVYQLDDFQVRTPTDITGQHIHLVKFDVTASDGAANGFNYEDGSFSPEEVIDRIDAINSGPNGGIIPVGGGTPVQLTPQPHPFFGTPGAQITVQRWFTDDVLNNNGFDRTLRTVFTHDHFGPSTHQQVGLYAGLVAEKEGSQWRDPETGIFFGTRFDGGPTSWRADILTPDPTQSFREFLVNFGDFQLAYRAGGGGTAEAPVPDPDKAINPPTRMQAPFQPPFVLLEKMEVCPETNFAPPCPEAISAADVGTMVVNYRNEPIPHRIWNFNGIGPEPGPNDFPQQAPGEAGDLANVYLSNIPRVDQRTNLKAPFYPDLTLGVAPGDPFTPLMRAFEADPVQIRILVGSQEEGHNFTVNGIKWLFEPGTPEDPGSINNSGYRNSQMMGISEHFEFHVPILPKPCQLCLEVPPPFYDFRYAPGAAVDDQWNGLWGILRAYRGSEPAGSIPPLLKLPSNPDGITGAGVAVCPAGARPTTWNVSAFLARDLLTTGTLVYNSRTNVGGRLEDPTAIMYVRDDDINPTTGKLKSLFEPEPLILRANAGDCITVNLTNRLTEVLDLEGHNTLPMIINNFNANQIMPSAKMGLHPQMLFYDVTKSDGMNVGFNPVQTVNPGQTIQYVWYAGDVKLDPITQQAVYTPVEFGATNLSSPDPIKHSNKGAIGAMIIEPIDTSGINDISVSGKLLHSHVQLSFTPSRPSIRENVLIFQNDVNLRFGSRTEFGHLKAVPNLGDEDDPEDTGQKAINYKTEPMWKRLGYEPDLGFSETRKKDFTNSLANIQVGGDPKTPIFVANRGTHVRFRVLMPGGHARNQGLIVHGHEWQEEPYINRSTQIGDNPRSEWKGSQLGHGPTNHFDVDLFYGAGGRFRVIGDYLHRDRASFTFDGGVWGIFRVQ